MGMLIINVNWAFDSICWEANDKKMSCIKTASFLALIEGSSVTIFKAQRGIKQGNVMLALLFVIVVEYIVYLTRKAVEERQLEIYINGGVCMEPQLAFADDIIFSCCASHKSFPTMNAILEVFSDFVRLKTNKTKSFTTLSAHVHDKVDLASILGCNIKPLPITYLGVPLTGKSISHKDCYSLIVDLQGILTRWGACN